MVFSSNVFLFYFLPIVLFGYFLINLKLRNVWLFLASLFFYVWGGVYYVTVMVSSIIINYILGISISHIKNQKVRKIILIVAVSCNLLILFYFKYFNFTVDMLGSVFKYKYTVKNIALPIGISFYIFQGLSYVVDVYREDVKAQKSFIKLGLYIALFPQLIAGPIIRYKDMATQIDKRRCDIDRCFYGIWRFVQGLAKKVIIANTVAEVADRIFDCPAGELSVVTAWLGIICYTFQIYFDFSGYSDMAIGLGRILGFTFPENFNYPYISTSITEFWKRWHISLSSFFRDYVYIPLGGNRKGNVYINLLVVFLLTGLWHGASYNFILWGLWHGFFIVLERLNKRQKFIKCESILIAKHIYTMLVVIIGWVFFRADTIEQAIQFIGRMFNIYPASQISFTVKWYLDRYIYVILCIAMIASLGGIKKIKDIISIELEKKKVLLLGKSAVLLFLLIISMIYVITSTYNPFIYFKF